MLALLKASLNLILLSAFEFFFFGYHLVALVSTPYLVWKTMILIPLLFRLYQGSRSVWFQGVLKGSWGRWSVCICEEWSVC